MHLTLHLTDACSMRCSYCYAPPRNGPAMTAATAARALELGARATRGSCGVVFFGGEPLLHKGLIAEIVARGRAMERRQAGRFHFKATTNGLALDAEFLEFADANDILVAMSFDGVKPAHDRHRLLPDGRPTFDLLLPKLRLLLEARPYASVLMVVTPETVAHYAESVAFLLDLGVRYVIASLNYAAPWTEEDFAVLARQYSRLGKRYVEWTRAGRQFYLSPFEVKLASHIAQGPERCDRCELGRRQLSVAPGGHIYPCVQFTRAGPESAWCIGDVERGVDEGRHTAIAAASAREREPCNECAISARCNHTCGCLNWQATGSIERVSPVLCRHERILLPIADRVGARLYRSRAPLFLRKHYNAAHPVLSLLEDAAGTRPGSAARGPLS